MNVSGRGFSVFVEWREGFYNGNEVGEIFCVYGASG